MLCIKGGGHGERERERNALLTFKNHYPDSSPPPPTPTGNQDAFSGLLEREDGGKPAQT